MARLVDTSADERRLSRRTPHELRRRRLSFLVRDRRLWAVVSSLVTERTRELGIRLALGGTRAGMSRLVLSQGLKLDTAGARTRRTRSLGNRTYTPEFPLRSARFGSGDVRSYRHRAIPSRRIGEAFFQPIAPRVWTASLAPLRIESSSEIEGSARSSTCRWSSLMRRSVSAGGSKARRSQSSAHFVTADASLYLSASRYERPSETVSKSEPSVSGLTESPDSSRWKRCVLKLSRVTSSVRHTNAELVLDEGNEAHHSE